MAKREDDLKVPRVEEPAPVQQPAEQRPAGLVQQPVQPPPWFVTRDEQIRLKALELAVQTTGSPNKVELARSYMRFLKPEEDVVA